MSERAAPSQLRRRLLDALGAQGVLLVILSVQEIILLPFFLHAWGLTLYRDWLVAITAAEFLARLDFGLQNYFSNAFMRHLTRAELPEYRRLRALAWTLYLPMIGLGLILLASLLGALSGGAWGALPAGWFELGLGGDGLGIASLALLGASVLLRLPLGPLQGVYRAHGEPARALRVEAVLSVARILLLAGGLSLGLAPVALAGGLAGLALLALIGVPLDQARRYGEPALRLCRPRARELRTSFSTGLIYNLESWGMTLATQGLLLAVARWAPDAAAVVLLSTARTLTGLMRQIALQIASVFGIEQSREHAAERGDALRRLHHVTLRLSGTAAGLMAALVGIMGGEILFVWSGDQLRYEPLLFALLLGAGLTSLPARAAAQLALYTNRPRAMASANLAQAMLLLGLTAVLAPRLGAIGAATALLLSEAVVMAGWLGRHNARSLGEPWRGQWDHGWRWSLLGLLAGGLLALGVEQLFTTLAAPIRAVGSEAAGVQLAARLALWGVLAAPLALWIGVPQDARRELLNALRTRLRPADGA